MFRRCFKGSRHGVPDAALYFVAESDPIRALICAYYFAERARKAHTDSDRERWSKVAAHYRELATP